MEVINTLVNLTMVIISQHIHTKISSCTFYFFHNMNPFLGQMTINRVFSITKQQDLLVLRGQEIRKWGKRKNTNLRKHSQLSH